MNSFLKIFLNSTFKMLEKYDSHILFLKENNLIINTKNSTRFQCFQFEGKKFFQLHVPPRMKFKKSVSIRRAVLEVKKKENVVEVNDFIEVEQNKERDMFPTLDLPDKLFNGIPFKNIPIVSVKTTKRNTIMTLDDNGEVKLLNSCGKAGFKNFRKGTAIAAQTTGTLFGTQALKKGYKNIRVVVKGLGNGRLNALKGMQLSGINIVSITDCTKDKMTQRPKKQRRL